MGKQVQTGLYKQRLPCMPGIAPKVCWKRKAGMQRNTSTQIVFFLRLRSGFPILSNVSSLRFSVKLFSTQSRKGGRKRRKEKRLPKH
jgi:hypothetical protein